VKIYTSKKEIYKNHALAIKLCLQIPENSYFAIRDYEEFINALKSELRARVEEFSRSVKNFDFEYPLSVGLFVEVPVIGDEGQSLGLRTVLLEHETGPEFFIPLTYAAAIAAGAWVGTKVVEKVFEKTLDKALEKLFNFFKQEWHIISPKYYSIDHIEFRTSKKGVMRMPFSEFDVSQLRCLLNKLPTAKHLRECNDCFDGNLVDPPGRSSEWSTEARQRGMAPPLQSCD
jgi:hypothetical protein